LPWSPDDAPRHTKLATTAKLRRMWAHTANGELDEHGDDGLAVKAANGVVKRAVTHGEMAKEAKGKRK
jgi:hypothetical protein